MQRTFTKATLVVSTILLAWMGVASAQLIYGDDYDWNAYQSYGQSDFTYAPHTEDDEGAIVLLHSTPSDQHANFDVVGPDDYWEHFDFSDDPGERYVLDDLDPGIYSIAATDDGLELSHTIVEVRIGEVVTVNLTLRPLPGTDEIAGAFDPAEYYGSYRGYDNAYPGYPYGAYDVAPAGAYDDADTGALAITILPDDVEVIVTGPNGFSEEIEDDALLEDLVPGIYAVAATADDADLSVTTIEIQAGQRIDITPTLILRN